MNELLTSLYDSFKKRTVSSALGTYSFFWLSYHWQGVYTVLFIDEQLIYDKFGYLKNEYLNTYFFNKNIESNALGFLIPLMLTAAFIWLVQKYILVFAYKEELNNKFTRRRIKLDAEEEFASKQKRVAIVKTEAIDKEVKLTQKVKSANDVWKKDFDEYTKDPTFPGFIYIIQSVYEHAGRIKPYYSGSREKINFEVPPGVLAIADSNELIELDNIEKTISLTNKGKYFVKRYPMGK